MMKMKIISYWASLKWLYFCTTAFCFSNGHVYLMFHITNKRYLLCWCL